MTALPNTTIDRFIGIDLHKHYLMVGGIDRRHRVVLPPRRISLDQWLAWAQANLRPTDAVVIEATTNAWQIYDQVTPLVARAVVAHPPKVKLIAAARVKTDKHDVIRLARLLVADLIPEVWVPPLPVRELRGLLAHRRRVVSLGTMSRNRLHSLIHRYNLTPPTGKLFAQKQRAWWHGLELSSTERLRVQQDLATLNHVAEQLAAIDAQLRQLSTSAPWAEQVPYLVQLPGFGLITAMTVLAAVGDIHRFPTAKQLVGYAGLGAGVHDSGETHRGGRITKEGRRELRWVLVEAAQTAVRRHPHWQREFARLERRLGTNKAVVAIARKLLVVVWHVLTHGVVDRQADAEQVAFKLMTWAWKLNDEQRGGLSSRQFIRYHLLRFGIGHDLTYIRRGGTPRPLATAEEVLRLRPELEGSP